MADPLLDYGAPDPDELRRRAAANLAADNAALDRVNAASRVITPFEGYSRVAQYQEPGTEARTTYGAPPATVNLRPAADTYDLTGPASGTIDYGAGTSSGAVPYVSPSAQPYGTAGNIGVEPPAPVEPVPTVTDAHLQDIADRRAQIADQRNQIMVSLGMLPPSAGGFAAVVLPQPKQRLQLLQNLQDLEHEDNRLLVEHHYATTEQARADHENFARENHIAAAQDFSDLSNTLLQIRKNPNLKEGTPEYAQAILQAAKDHPAGFQTQAGQLLVRGMSQVHDKAADLEDRAYWQRFGQAFKEASVVARQRGVDVQFDDQGFPSTQLTSTVGGGVSQPSPQIMRDYTNLRVNRAEQAAYLDKEVDPAKRPELQKKIDILDAQIAAAHKQFPSLNPANAEPPSGAPGTPTSIRDYVTPAAMRTPSAATTVTMIAPDGKTEKPVPVDQVEHYKKLGAKVK